MIETAILNEFREANRSVGCAGWDAGFSPASVALTGWILSGRPDDLACFVVKEWSQRISGSVGFFPDSVDRVAEILYKLGKRAASAVSKDLQIMVDALSSRACDAFTADMESVFGRLGPYHGLNRSHSLGFNAHEPQITCGLAHFLLQDGRNLRSADRIRGFVLAILEHCPESFVIDSSNGAAKRVRLEQMIESAKTASLRSFSVQPEVVVEKQKRRIDLLITWPSLENSSADNRCFGLVIEAKFGHKVTTGQLSTYKRYATKNFAASVLVLLTCEGESSNRNKDWLPVSWWTLMCRWERMLDDADPAFSCFRQLIWSKL